MMPSTGPEETPSVPSASGAGDASASPDPSGSSGAAPAPARKGRDWSGVRKRAVPALLAWLFAVVACYFVGLMAPAPGLPAPIAWLISPIETNPFRACHVEAEGAPPVPADQPVQKSSLFIRESFAQESAPVEQAAPSKGGDFSNTAAPEQQQQQEPPPQQQQQQQQQPQPEQAAPPQQQQALSLTGAATGCSSQGFGDLIDGVMDQSGQKAWVVNAHGQLYRSLDGGRNWSGEELPELAEGERLTTIALASDDASLIIAVQRVDGAERSYRFLRSDDGGDSWKIDPALDSNPKMMAAFPGNPTIVGLGLGPKGQSVLAIVGTETREGGPMVWRADAPYWQIDYGAVEPAMLRGLRTHNLGDPRHPINASGATDPPILSWEQDQDGRLVMARIVSDAKDKTGALTEESTTAFDVDGDTYRAVAASDKGEDVFIAESNAILHGNARKEPWSRIDLSALAPASNFALFGIDVADNGRTIMAVGTNALFVSHDGGATFFEPPLGRAPAPWFYLILVSGPLFVFYVLRPRKPETITVKGDKSNALSDRAQGLKGADALNLRAYADGIFDLLRNAATQPPLVIGVTGPWGSGKSSVMLKLAELLREKQMPTVWFNAWHHQNEDHLLASMLSNIRDQGIPGFWTNPGFRLRWRMLMRRLSRIDPIGPFLWSWFLLLLAGLLIPGVLLLWAAYSLNLVPALGDAQQFNWSAVGGFVQKEFCQADSPCAELVDDVARLLPGGKLGAIVAFLISLLSLDRLGRVALITRGFDPGKLMASMMPAGRNPKLDDQLSFRHRFGEELRTTAEELKPYRMVIFIDDLDRCRPENVVAVLEAVNFVVSEAECYVVIGMDRLYVLRAIRQQFEKFIAMEAAERKSGLGGPEEDEGRPLDFAEHYLEKLINLFVAVPKMSEAAREKLMEQMAGAEQAAWEEEPAKPMWPSRLRRAAAAFVIGAVILSPTWYLIGHQPSLGGQEQSEGPATTQAAKGKPAATQPPETAPAAAPVVTPQIGASGVGRTAGVPSVDMAGLIGFAIIALAIAATAIVAVMRALNVPPDLLKHDTSAFRTELRNAEKRLASYLTTPRRAKRFVNRLRLFASVLKSTRTPAPPQPPEGSPQITDADRLDRQIVVAGTLHTFGRELLAARQTAEEPQRQKLVQRMSEIYSQTPDHPTIDRLYWRFWGVIDGAKCGDPEIASLVPGILPAPEEDDEEDDRLAPQGAQATAAQ